MDACTAYHGRLRVGRAQSWGWTAYGLKEQCWPISLHDTVCDVRDFKVGTDRLCDASEFALGLQSRQERLEVAMCHVRFSLRNLAALVWHKTCIFMDATARMGRENK